MSIADESTSPDHWVVSYTQTSQGIVNVVETTEPLAVWAPKEAFTLNVQNLSPSQAESTAEDSDSTSATSPEATQSSEDGVDSQSGSAEPVVSTIVNGLSVEDGDETTTVLSQSSLDHLSPPSQ